MTDDTMVIAKPNGPGFIAAKDSVSGLYFLTMAITQENSWNSVGLSKNKFLYNSLLLARTSFQNLSDNDALWRLHLKHGHRNFKDICRQYKIPVPKVMPSCTSCVMGKSHVHPHFESSDNKATRRAEGFHSDFKGPFSTEAANGAKFLLTITDDYTRRIFAFLVRSQAEWYDIWIKFVARIEAELGRANCISWILTDNGAVYKAGNMAQFCSAKGIQQKFSAPYSQWMNGVAERNMRTIGEMLTTTMVHANLPQKAWGYAVLLACEVINRTSESAISNARVGAHPTFSRLEKWHGKALPNQARSLYPLGCLCFKHVPSELRSKSEAHAIPMVYLGFESGSRAYLLGSLFELYTSTSVEVTFMENAFPFRRLKYVGSPTALLWGAEQIMASGDTKNAAFMPDAPEIARLVDRQAGKTITSVPEPIAAIADAHDPVLCDQNAIVEVKQNEESQLRRSSRVSQPLVQPNQKYRVAGAPPYTLSAKAEADEDLEFILLTMMTEASLQSITPRNAHEAMKSPQRKLWLLAMNREKQCHIKNGTFGKVLMQQALKSIPADWVFRIKHRGGPVDINDLAPKQFKARVVVRGQFMREGINFNDTFAPVAKQTSLRALLAFATANGCKLKSGDVETAFLTADMDVETYVKMPPYWGNAEDEITGDITVTTPRILLKGVPGIPQGSRLFYETFSAHLLTIGYKPTLADKCLFVNADIKEKNAVLLWVDDFVHMHETEEVFNKFMVGIRLKFTVPTVGSLTGFLGIEIIYDPAKRKLNMNQSSSIDVLLERAGMTDCNAASTPCVAGFIFTKGEPGAPDEKSIKEYRSLVAMANFISCWTRPDVTFTVNKLCKFMASPTDAHWSALKHLLRYLKGTRSLGLQYDFGEDKGHRLIGYTDSSFADCIDTGRSTIAYTFLYGPAILSWYSKLNTYVTTSTNHAEYCALAQGAKEAEWLIALFKEIDPGKKLTPVPMLVDNSGVVSMVLNPVSHQANKHIRISCHYTRELTANKVIAPQRISTEENLADAFTKALPLATFTKLTERFMAAGKPKAVTMLMMRHKNNDEDAEAKVAANQARRWEEFHSDWPYANEVRRKLNADEYETVETEEYFPSTGRRKYQAIFYKVDGNRRTEVARSTAMRLVNKTTNRAYMVCQWPDMSGALEPSYSPPQEEPSYSPSSPVPAGRLPVPSSPPPFPREWIEAKTTTIAFVQPTPSLSCCKCLMINTPQFAMFECRSCGGTAFNWSCACTGGPPVHSVPSSSSAAPTPMASNHVPSANVPVVSSVASKPLVSEPAALKPAAEELAPRARSARAKVHKSWVQQIKYKSPIGRYTVYHKIECPTLEGPDVQISNIEFANAHLMKQAQCCFSP